MFAEKKVIKNYFLEEKAKQRKSDIEKSDRDKSYSKKKVIEKNKR